MRVLVLLGFAATDFVITMTLSAADAAKHAIENPFLYSVLGGTPNPRHAHDSPRTCRGFPERIHRSDRSRHRCRVTFALNLVVLGRCAWEVVAHPSLFGNWSGGLALKKESKWKRLITASLVPC